MGTMLGTTAPSASVRVQPHNTIFSGLHAQQRLPNQVYVPCEPSSSYYCPVAPRAKRKKLELGRAVVPHCQGVGVSMSPSPETSTVNLTAASINTNLRSSLESIDDPVGAVTLQDSVDEEPDVELLDFDDTLLPRSPDTGVDEENPYSTIDALSAESEGVGGEPELERLLAEQGRDLSVDRIQRVFPFPLDNFQKKALERLLEGKSVVVCAPTGAGKTAIAEAAAAAALARGQRVIYTTPLKALSNQKLFETRKRFGVERCGLQTGDASLNTEAAIVVMTTEILRNIMYRTAELSQENNTNPTATREARLGDVGLIVLDEVHYLGDPARGSVWEEVIINCPKHIQLLCMSATVKNPDDLGAWISQEHGECETIKTKFRPVPLHWHFAWFKTPRVVFADLLDQTGKNLNPELTMKKWAKEEAIYMLKQSNKRPVGFSRRGGRQDPVDSAVQMLLNSRPASPARRTMVSRRIPTMEGVISKLNQLDMLPAIWFILSRKDCDISTVKAGMAPPLITAEQSAEIAKELEALRQDQPEAVREKLVPALLHGVASHHAGHLPGWKALVERLFQRGLLKLVFATGTLAAGINMPARSTIISSLSRITENGPDLLPHNELLQMAGRAGRRGFDTEGHCIILQNRYEGAEDGFQILAKGPEPLVSQFTVGYGLVLNLLSIYSLEEAKEFVAKSFGNFMQTEGNARKLAEADQLQALSQQLMMRFRQTASEQIKELNANVKEQKSRLRSLKAAALNQRVAAVASRLPAAGLPRKVVLNLTRSDQDKPLLLPALVMREVDVPAPPPGISSDSYRPPIYECLTADNRLMRVSVVHVVGILDGDEGTVMPDVAEKVLVTLNSLRPQSWANLEPGMYTCQVALGNTSTAVAALQLQQRHKWTMIEMDSGLAQQILAQRNAIQAAIQELEAQRKQISSQGAQPADSIAIMNRARKLMKRAEQLRMEAGAQLENTWKSFQDVVEILISMDALEAGTLRVLPNGLVARNIQGQNELWLALALTHPAVFRLTGPQLAAFLGALLSNEVMKRPQTIMASYSASDMVMEAVEALEPVRQLLFELQTEAGLMRWNETLAVDLRLAGIVEAWAAGASWAQIMEDSSMDDGDMARLLIRVIDMLKQIKVNGHVLPHLRQTAMEALKGMDRKPVAELVF